eukprot:1004260-Prymnesium_polylepis.1
MPCFGQGTRSAQGVPAHTRAAGRWDGWASSHLEKGDEGGVSSPLPRVPSQLAASRISTGACLAWVTA